MSGWEMTVEEIAPHQVEVAEVRYLGEHQAITGDTWRCYQAPDGEVCEVRTACGAYAPDAPRWSGRKARRAALEVLNLRREGRALRIAEGMPVTCQLTPTHPAARRAAAQPWGW